MELKLFVDRVWGNNGWKHNPELEKYNYPGGTVIGLVSNLPGLNVVEVPDPGNPTIWAIEPSGDYYGVFTSRFVTPSYTTEFSTPAFATSIIVPMHGEVHINFYLADNNLREAGQNVAAEGWTNNPCKIVITGDGGIEPPVILPPPPLPKKHSDYINELVTIAEVLKKHSEDLILLSKEL